MEFDFPLMLKKGEKTAEKDRLLFHSWEKGRITTKECIHQFRKNNDILPRRRILVEEFEQWLNSLGYYNDKTSSKVPRGGYR